MKDLVPHTSRAHVRKNAQMRIGFIATVAVAAALAGGAYQYHRHVQAQRAAAQQEAENAAALLSPSTETVLNGLKSPIEIRFYSLLDPKTTPASTRAFAERVSELLAKYERDGNGKIHVTRISEINDANSEAAAADGIRGFNRDKGDTCFLGIAADRAGLKEAIAELAPDWEEALEADLSRVVGRVNEMKPAGATPANVSDRELAAAQKVIDSNPNLASATLDQGTQLLRDEALAQFKAEVAEMDSQIAGIENQVKQGNLSAADAGSQIEHLRAVHTQKIQQITSGLHNQLAAFTQSKTASP